jgi:hypothetical protein
MSAINPQTHMMPYMDNSSSTPAPAPQTTAGGTTGAPSMVAMLSHQYSPQVQLYPPPTGSHNHWTYAVQYGTQTYPYPRSEYYPTSSATGGSTTSAPHYRPFSYVQPYNQAQYRGGQLNWQQPYQGPPAQASSTPPALQASTSGSDAQLSTSQQMPGTSQSYYRDASQSTTSTAAPVSTITSTSSPCESPSTYANVEASATAASSLLPTSTEQDHSAAIKELAALSPQETARIAEYLSGMPELRDAVNAAVMRAKQQMS